jgi:hypothetical protein
MHEIHIVSVGINVINVLILAMLISVYFKNYRVLKSSHNKGLLIFSLLFLAENAIQIHLGIFNWPYQAVDIIMHIVVVNVLQLLGLLTLLKVTWK